MPVERSAAGGGIGPAEPVQDALAPFEDGGDLLDWHYTSTYVDLIAGLSGIDFYKLDLPRDEEGAFPIIVRLVHVSAPGGQLEVRGYVDPAKPTGFVGESEVP
jgi:hypothetical protein